MMTPYILLALSIEAEADGGVNNKDKDEHHMFDYVIGVFIAFTVLMILFHCYLKRQARRLVEENSLDESIATV